MSLHSAVLGLSAQVLRLVGVSNLITLLAHSKEEISRPAALTMANLALDPEGVDAIMKDPSGAAVSALIGLLEVSIYHLQCG